MTLDYGKGQAQRTCAAADRTGHAMLHTMYGQALRHAAEFYIEFFAIDLIMDDQGVCRGVIALKLDDGTLHRFRAQTTILATGGYGRAYASCTSAHTCTGDGGAMACAPACRCRTWSSCSSIPPAFTVRAVSSPKARAAKALSRQFGRRAVHGALRALRQGPRLARRGLARDDHRNPRRPRRRQEEGSYLPAPRHLDPKVLHERLPGISESAKIFANVDVTREPIPILRPCTTIWAASRPFHAEVLTKRNGDDNATVPGLMALGEAACVSVHGANRLGSNSLIDLVVFGRAAALRCAEKLTRTASSRNCRPARPTRRSDGSIIIATPPAARDREIARQHAACDAEQLRGVPHRRNSQRRPEPDSQGARRHRRHFGQRPLADLEFGPDRDARIRQSDRAGGRDDGPAANRTESRGAHAARIFPRATTRTG